MAWLQRRGVDTAAQRGLGLVALTFVALELAGLGAVPSSALGARPDRAWVDGRLALDTQRETRHWLEQLAARADCVYVTPVGDAQPQQSLLQRPRWLAFGGPLRGPTPLGDGLDAPLARLDALLPGASCVRAISGLDCWIGQPAPCDALPALVGTPGQGAAPVPAWSVGDEYGTVGAGLSLRVVELRERGRNLNVDLGQAQLPPVPAVPAGRL